MYVGAYSNAAVSGNKNIEISGNKSADAAIYASGNTFTLSNNGTVLFSGNSDSAGHVISNAGGSSVMEIAHNASVIFSGNTSAASAKSDIYNVGKLYVSADADKSITFEYGIKNGSTGVAYLGKDSAGTVSTGGTYNFVQNGKSVTMQNMGTTVAAIGNNGGMEFAEGMFTVSHTEFASTNLAFTLETSSLKFSDVTFASEAVMTVDCGYFAEVDSFLYLDDVTGSNVGLSMLIDLVDSKATVKTTALQDTPLNTGLQTKVFSTKQSATLYLDDYFFAENINWDQLDLDLSFIINGEFVDGSPLIIDVGSTGISRDQITAYKYTFNRMDEEGLLYYEVIPEPASSTLSLLALAGLCARRRRKC